LEWLTLLGEAASHERTMNLIENSYAARSAQADADGFKSFTWSLKRTL